MLLSGLSRLFIMSNQTFNIRNNILNIVYIYFILFNNNLIMKRKYLTKGVNELNQLYKKIINETPHLTIVNNKDKEYDSCIIDYNWDGERKQKKVNLYKEDLDKFEIWLNLVMKAYPETDSDKKKPLRLKKINKKFYNLKIRKMFWLTKRQKLISLINNHKEYLYLKTSLYNPLINDKDWEKNLKVNKEYINGLNKSEIDKWYTEVKVDLKWHKII